MSVRDLETWMWADACELLNRAERLHRQFFRPSSRNLNKPVWEPPVDVFATGNDLWLVVALPGVTTNDIEVLLHPEMLVVVGERKLPIGSRDQILRLEIPHGRFERRIGLPVGRYRLIGQEFVNGCLTINLRKH